MSRDHFRRSISRDTNLQVSALSLEIGGNCKRLNKNQALSLKTTYVYFPFKIDKVIFSSDVTRDVAVN